MKKETTREEETPTVANTSGDAAALTRHDATDSAPDAPESEWVTTEVAAAALGVSPRTIRGYIQDEQLKAKSEGEGVTKRWLVSLDGVHALRKERRASPGRLCAVAAQLLAQLLGKGFPRQRFRQSLRRSFLPRYRICSIGWGMLKLGWRCWSVLRGLES
jgi:hypothetical protein